jgi:hypothetical protein
MGWLRLPRDDNPATMLRWMRRLHLVTLPAALLTALVLRADDVAAWWLGLAAAAVSMIRLATIGPAIRRAEARGPNDPATRRARQHRAERVTLALFGALAAIAVVVGYLIEGLGLAITFAATFGLSHALGIWLYRRWFRPGAGERQPRH